MKTTQPHLRLLPVLVSSLLAQWACKGGTKTEGVDANGPISSLELSPLVAELTTSSAAPETLQFVATVTFASGHVEEGFEQVAWSQSNSAAGTIDEDGLFTTSTTNGGRTFVTAESGGLSVTADVSVTYEEVALDEGVPDGAEAWFEGSAQSGALALAYPTDGVDVPRNLPAMEFNWFADETLDYYRLSFDSSTTHVAIITAEPRVVVDGALWRVITSTNAGGQVDISLQGVSVEGGTVTALIDGTGAAMLVNRLDAEGAIYYFMTTSNGGSNGGIMRAPVDDIEVEAYLAKDDALNVDNCVGCHVISADGERMAYAVAVDRTTNRMGLAVLSEDALPEPMFPEDTTVDPAYFSEFSPDGTLLAIAESGTINLYDGRTGDWLNTLSHDADLTMPAWSPDGTTLAAVEVVNLATDVVFTLGRILTFPHLGGGDFDAPATLIERVDGLNQYYPAYSPDGDWLVFNRSSGDVYFAADAALWLVDAEGGVPIELLNTGSEGANASWPRWGPIPDDDVLWLAFTSNRDVGAVESPLPQVWLAGIDITVAEEGLDPSFPAFRMPQQDYETANHAPVWSEF